MCKNFSFELKSEKTRKYLLDDWDYVGVAEDIIFNRVSALAT